MVKKCSSRASALPNLRGNCTNGTADDGRPNCRSCPRRRSSLRLLTELVSFWRRASVRISTKGDYGVRALVELAHHYGEGPVQSAEIAGRQGIPEPYLDQILTTMRRAGLIRSVRGPQGGHTLARPPAEIHLA